MTAPDQWGEPLQAQCGCRDVRSNGDGRDRGEPILTKQERITGSLNTIFEKNPVNVSQTAYLQRRALTETRESGPSYIVSTVTRI